MAHVDCRPRGVCSSRISYDIEDGIVSNIKFTGGCDGNLKMLSKLLSGKSAEFIVNNCRGNTCGFKNTSCVDQLALSILQQTK